MIELEGGATLASRVPLQYGGGTYLEDSSTLTVTDGSSIDGNTAGRV